MYLIYLSSTLAINWLSQYERHTIALLLNRMPPTSPSCNVLSVAIPTVGGLIFGHLLYNTCQCRCIRPARNDKSSLTPAWWSRLLLSCNFRCHCSCKNISGRKYGEKIWERDSRWQLDFIKNWHKIHQAITADKQRRAMIGIFYLPMQCKNSIDNQWAANFKPK